MLEVEKGVDTVPTFFLSLDCNSVSGMELSKWEDLEHQFLPVKLPTQFADLSSLSAAQLLSSTLVTGLSRGIREQLANEYKARRAEHEELARQRQAARTKRKHEIWNSPMVELSGGIDVFLPRPKRRVVSNFSATRPPDEREAISPEPSLPLVVINDSPSPPPEEEYDELKSSPSIHDEEIASPTNLHPPTPPLPSSPPPSPPPTLGIPFHSVSDEGRDEAPHVSSELLLSPSIPTTTSTAASQPSCQPLTPRDRLIRASLSKPIETPELPPSQTSHSLISRIYGKPRLPRPASDFPPSETSRTVISVRGAASETRWAPMKAPAFVPARTLENEGGPRWAPNSPPEERGRLHFSPPSPPLGIDRRYPRELSQRVTVAPPPPRRKRSRSLSSDDYPKRQRMSSSGGPAAVGGDRTHLIPNIPLSEYEPYLTRTSVELAWSRDYLFAQLEFLRACQPFVERWSPMGMKIGLFTYRWKGTPRERDITACQPARVGFGKLGSVGPNASVDGRDNKWSACLTAMDWIWRREATLGELRWILQEAPMPILGLIFAFGDVCRFREAVRIAWKELLSYLESVHPIKVEKHLHRALVLVDFLSADEDLVGRKRAFFFCGRIDSTTMRTVPLWERYFKGEDEQLVERLEKEFNAEMKK